MRYVRYAILAVLAIVLFTLAIANRDPVVLRFLPPGMAEAMGGSWAVQMPLFLVILGSAVIGLGVGFIWEWLREHRYRRTARKATQEAKKLDAEVSQLRRETGSGLKAGDDVLALLDTRVR